MHVCDLCGKKAYDDGYLAIRIPNGDDYDLCQECDEEWKKICDSNPVTKKLEKQVYDARIRLQILQNKLHAEQASSATEFVNQKLKENNR